MSEIINFDLTPWQKEVYCSDARFKVVVAGRRCGKTRLSAVQLITKATQCPSFDARVMYIAPTQGMAYDLMWQLVMHLAEPLIAKAHINDGDITLKNGIMIQIRGADKPDRLRGKKLFYAILDEMKDIKSGTWESSVRPSLADLEGGALFIGTPHPEAEEFRKYYDFGQEDNDKYDPEWKSWHFTTADNPYIKKTEIQAAKNTMGAAEFFREFEASWDTTGANVLKLEWFKKGAAPQGEYSTYIAIDPSGYESVVAGKKKHLDYFAIAIVRIYDNGHWWVQKIDYGRWDVREAAVRVLMAIRTHKPLAIGIEKGSLMRALMPYLEDLMRKNQVFAHIHPIPTASSSKINRITYALQGLMEHGRITFNQDENWDELKREMIGFPSERVHDDCFPADAPIITMSGIKPIVDVTTDDYVLTRNGYRKVLKAWCKGTKDVITRFGITATHEHRIFTENKGWVSLDSLSTNDILLECKPIKETSCEKQSSLMGGSTIDTQTQSKIIIGSIIQDTASGKHPQKCSTGKYGNSITGRSLPDTTSIILMETTTTTMYQTLPAYQVPPTKWSIEKKEAREVNQKEVSPTSEISETLQKNGTPHQKVENGTGNMHYNQSQKAFQNSHALSAEQCIDQRSADQVCVAQNAKESEQINFQKKGVPVYDLTIEEDHEFFAYGVLVHNCLDSLANVAHLSTVTYGRESSEPEWEPLDAMAGV